MAAGAALLAGSAAVHLDLYLTGYSRIPTIGPLFLLQVLVTAGLAASIAAGSLKRVPRRLQVLLCLGGGLTALGTLSGYLISLDVGLFGFHEVPTTAGALAGGLELGAALVLLGPLTLRQPGAQDRQRERLVAPVVLGVALLAGAGALAGGLSTSAAQPGGTSTASPAEGTTTRVVTVDIRNFAYQPDVVRVPPGARVRVVNEDPVSHTLTASGNGRGQTFSSGLIPPGSARTFTAPRRPGRYPFFCQIHQYMTGVLVVT